MALDDYKIEDMIEHLNKKGYEVKKIPEWTMINGQKWTDAYVRIKNEWFNCMGTDYRNSIHIHRVEVVDWKEAKCVFGPGEGKIFKVSYTTRSDPLDIGTDFIDDHYIYLNPHNGEWG